MLKFDEQFHCLGCEKLLPYDAASVLFRTGYFRVTHPLGCCKSCDHEGTGETLDREAAPVAARDISQSRFAYYSISA